MESRLILSVVFLNRLSPRKRGIIYLLLSSFSFACMALFINLAGDMPVFQKAFFRNLVAIAMSYIILARSPEKFRIKKGSLPSLFMRASFGTIGVIANFYAISTTNMSDAMMLNKLSPFFAMLTSIIVLKEAADGFQWAAILTAIAGAVFVVKPSFLFGSLGISGDSFFPLLVALVGGICAGIAYTFLRKATLKGERGIVVVAFFSTFSCVALIPFIIFTYQPISLLQFFFCVMVIFTALLGLIFLGEIPDWLSIIGYLIIIGASVMNYLYNNNILKIKKTDHK